jgi:hypothetical protein
MTKRFGFDYEPDREQRFRRIETELTLIERNSLRSTQTVEVFDPSSLVASGTDTDGTYGSISITTFSDTVVLPYINFALDYTSTVADIGDSLRLTADLLRGGVKVGESFVYDFLVSATKRLTLVNFADSDTPGAGTFEYTIKLAVERTVGNDITLTPNKLVWSLVGTGTPAP